MSFRQRVIVSLIAFNVALYVVWLYFPLLGWGYIWDDLSVLRDALDYTAGSPLHPAVFAGSNFYRPLGYLSFVVEARLFGVSPTVSHLINILLLGLTIAVVFVAAVMLLAGKLGGVSRIVLSVIIAIVIASLPLMGEPVAWVSARFELLSLLFALLAVVCYFSLLRPLAKEISLGFLFLCALLCKESVAPLIIVLPLVSVLREPLEVKAFLGVVSSPHFFRPLRALAVGFCLYSIFRLWMFHGLFTPVSVLDYYSFGEHLRLVVESVSQYFRILLIPWEAPAPFYVVGRNAVMTPGWWTVLLVGLLLLSLLVLLAYKTRKKRFLIPVLFVVWLLPVINLLPIFPGLFSVAPRYLVAPVVMTVVAILLWAPIISSRLILGFSMLIGVCIVAVAVPANRVFVQQYETDERFWDVLVDRYGLYHPVVAMNAVSSKFANAKYDIAYERLVGSRADLTLSQEFVERHVVQLGYARGVSDAEALELVWRKLSELSSGKALMALGEAQSRADLARWLNMSALYSVQTCSSPESVRRLALSVLSMDQDLTSQIVVAATASPQLFLLAGYPLHEIDSPFRREQGRELVRLLQRDLRRCGAAAL